MSREQQLKKEGWQKRFTIDEPRLSEMVEQYKEIGFEVLLEPVDTTSEECTTCLKDPAFSDRYKTIYTRPKNLVGSGRDSHPLPTERLVPTR